MTTFVLVSSFFLSFFLSSSTILNLFHSAYLSLYFIYLFFLFIPEPKPCLQWCIYQQFLFLETFIFVSFVGKHYFQKLLEFLLISDSCHLNSILIIIKLWISFLTQLLLQSQFQGQFEVKEYFMKLCHQI